MVESDVSFRVLKPRWLKVPGDSGENVVVARGRTLGERRAGTVGATLLSLAIVVAPASAANQVFGRYTVVEDSLSGDRNLGLRAIHGTRLDTVRQTLDLPLPDLGETRVSIGLRVFARVVGPTPEGRLRAAIFKERGDEPQEFVSRGRPRFENGFAFTEFLFPPDTFAADDNLSARISFSGDTELGEGDEIRLGAAWFTTDSTARGQGSPGEGRGPVPESSASGDFDVPFENLTGGRRVVLETTNGARLGRLERMLELSIPDLTSESEANVLVLQADALILSAQTDSPKGHARFVFWRLPAGGGPRELLDRSVAKLSFRAGVGVLVPMPSDFGLGDRIVVRVFFKTDWRFQAAFGNPSVTLNASWTPHLTS